MRTLLLMVLLLPQLAVAGVYMCVDQETGKTSFTDKGCETIAAREEVRVPAVNLDSGKNAAERPEEKIWSSERETRKTGRDYNADRRSTYENRATAQAQ